MNNKKNSLLKREKNSLLKQEIVRLEHFRGLLENANGLDVKIDFEEDYVFLPLNDVTIYTGILMLNNKKVIDTIITDECFCKEYKKIIKEFNLKNDKKEQTNE